MKLRFEHVDPQGDVALALLREAAVDARALYPELHGPDAPWPTNSPLPQRGAYVVGYDGDVAVACGALSPLGDTTAEVRRMYVHRDHRRKGLGREVLLHLERQARSLGYATLRLETGNKQLPAMALYEGHGFRRIAPFGAYANDPTSVCYERHLNERLPTTTVVFDLFHTLTGLESEWWDVPFTYKLLGVDRKGWNDLITTGSRWRLAGEERDPRRILGRLAREMDPTISDEVIEKATAIRIERFRHAMQNIPPANVETLQRLRSAGYALGLISNADAVEVAAWSDS
ncbi:MAG: GNAT family N-acetyltransferase, partial [Burkholderiales bacterium]